MEIMPFPGGHGCVPCAFPGSYLRWCSSLRFFLDMFSQEQGLDDDKDKENAGRAKRLEADPGRHVTLVEYESDKQIQCTHGTKENNPACQKLIPPRFRQLHLPFHGLAYHVFLEA